jgi:predicted pyridoxine 5'-phosphate oxidase superfamily flavin-nucleotide-binding protein
VQVRQSFGNCPRYIRVRTLAPVPRAQRPVQIFETGAGNMLPPAAVQMIAQCETLFVATASGSAAQPLARGVDISHRGGPAGFVRVDGRMLTVPDYPGNRYFNTLGNMLLEPCAALVLVDFATGDMLHLQGVAEVNWQPDALPADPLAQRAWTFRVVRGWLRPGAFPYAGA